MLQTSTKQLKKKSSDLIAELPEEVIDEILEGETFEVEPEGITEEELQQIIDESGIKEAIDSIQSDFKQAVDDFKDLDVTLADGLDELDELEPTPPVDLSNVRKAKPQGLIDQTMEQRTVKSQPQVEDDKFRKGPLWQYRTNTADDDKAID